MMLTYERGDYVKVEFSDDVTGIGEWMWALVDHGDDEKQLVFGTLDNEPLNDAGGKLRVGAELAIAYSRVRWTSQEGRPKARLIRATVRSSLILHSQTRRTLQPSLRSFRFTRRSRRRFEMILGSQNAVLLFDRRSQRGHPCQKHPSTNRATLDLGQAKSGLPAATHCFLKPLMP